VKLINTQSDLILKKITCRGPHFENWLMVNSRKNNGSPTRMRIIINAITNALPPFAKHK
jgi:hypothetical protein